MNGRTTNVRTLFADASGQRPKLRLRQAANLVRAKTCAASGVVDCLLLIQEYGVNARRFKALPAV
ncbi:MAG: hypothetical protein DME33_05665 [Verrucomicrobia bacterium]|nr:MAG: hypothetical protein DME33_05665 [Verrucomicrobiota bacterium]